MNAKRRKEISNVIDAINKNIVDKLDDILSEEQDAFDNMPESLQDSERGENSQNAIDNLESSKENLEAILETLNDAMS